jgi:hypothetical protein
MLSNLLSMDETPYPAANDSSRRRRLAIHLLRKTRILPAVPSLQGVPNSARTGVGRPSSVESLEQWLRLIRRPERLIWLFAGDSLSTPRKSPAWSGNHASYFVRLIGGRLSRDDDAFITTARPGGRMRDLLQRFDEDVARFQPDIVVLSCGCHELSGESQSLMEFEETIRQLVGQIRLNAGTPILTTPSCPVPFEESTLLTDQLIRLEAIRACAIETHTLLVDHWLHWEQAASPDWYRSDCRTPSDQGAAEMANLFIRSLQLDKLDGERPAGESCPQFATSDEE